MKTKLIQKINKEWNEQVDSLEVGHFGGIFNANALIKFDADIEVETNIKSFLKKEVWNFIEKAISQSKEEERERIVRNFEEKSTFENGTESEGWYTITKDDFDDCFLEDLNKK